MRMQTGGGDGATCPLNLLKVEGDKRGGTGRRQQVDLQMMEHHARAGKASPELGDERAASAPAPGQKWRVRIRDQIQANLEANSWPAKATGTARLGG